jgi:hypothetical protein
MLHAGACCLIDARWGSAALDSTRPVGFRQCYSDSPSLRPAGHGGPLYKRPRVSPRRPSVQAAPCIATEALCTSGPVYRHGGTLYKRPRVSPRRPSVQAAPCIATEALSPPRCKAASACACAACVGAGRGARDGGECCGESSPSRVLLW